MPPLTTMTGVNRIPRSTTLAILYYRVSTAASILQLFFIYYAMNFEIGYVVKYSSIL